MNVVKELQNLRTMQSIGPNPAWVESTRAELLQFCQSNDHAGVVPARPLFIWKYALVGVPVALGLLVAALVTRQRIVLPQGGAGTGNGGVPQTAPARIALDPNLPLAQSVQFSTPKSEELALVPNQSRTTPKAPARQLRKVPIQRPLARTRLAVSIQSLPEAKWVFSENLPGEHARWVFSSREQMVNSFGT